MKKPFVLSLLNYDSSESSYHMVLLFKEQADLLIFLKRKKGLWIVHEMLGVGLCVLFKR